jgi:hypothetical protein
VDGDSDFSADHDDYCYGDPYTPVDNPDDSNYVMGNCGAAL